MGAAALPRHRGREFIHFLERIDGATPLDLDLHLIVDNYSTHKSPPVQRWLKRHPRFHLHFTPTSMCGQPIYETSFHGNWVTLFGLEIVMISSCCNQVSTA